jgi:hypothetical protein
MEHKATLEKRIKALMFHARKIKAIRDTFYTAQWWAASEGCFF